MLCVCRFVFLAGVGLWVYTSISPFIQHTTNKTKPKPNQVGYPTGDDGVGPLTPRECRERGLMYAAPVRATFRIQRDDGPVMRVQR